MARKDKRPPARKVGGEAEGPIALRGQGEAARFPAAPIKAGLPRDYADALGAIKRRIQEERLRVVLAANAAMVLLYWDIGRIGHIDWKAESGRAGPAARGPMSSHSAVDGRFLSRYLVGIYSPLDQPSGLRRGFAFPVGTGGTIARGAGHHAG